MTTNMYEYRKNVLWTMRLSNGTWTTPERISSVELERRLKMKHSPTNDVKWKHLGRVYKLENGKVSEKARSGITKT